MLWHVVVRMTLHYDVWTSEDIYILSRQSSMIHFPSLFVKRKEKILQRSRQQKFHCVLVIRFDSYTLLYSLILPYTVIHCVILSVWYLSFHWSSYVIMWCHSDLSYPTFWFSNWVLVFSVYPSLPFLTKWTEKRKCSLISLWLYWFRLSWIKASSLLNEHSVPPLPRIFCLF